MKKSILLFTILLFTSAFSVIFGQTESIEVGDQAFNPGPRPNLMQELGLSRQQIQQLREVNKEWQPRLRKAQQAFKEAQDQLDEVIYREVLDDAVIEQKLESVHKTHTEVIKTRTTMQTLTRKILTPEQLIKFRELREQFANRNQNLRRIPNNPRNRPNQQRPPNRRNRPPL